MLVSGMYRITNTPPPVKFAEVKVTEVDIYNALKNNEPLSKVAHLISEYIASMIFDETLYSVTTANIEYAYRRIIRAIAAVAKLLMWQVAQQAEEDPSVSAEEAHAIMDRLANALNIALTRVISVTGGLLLNNEPDTSALAMARFGYVFSKFLHILELVKSLFSISRHGKPPLIY